MADNSRGPLRPEGRITTSSFGRLVDPGFRKAPGEDFARRPKTPTELNVWLSPRGG